MILKSNSKVSGLEISQIRNKSTHNIGNQVNLKDKVILLLLRKMMMIMMRKEIEKKKTKNKN
jgi:hypothetical protein